MKKFKMVVSIIMTMVLMLSAFSVTASAAVPTDEVVLPQYEAARCPDCNRATQIVTETTERVHVESACKLCGAMIHHHLHVTTNKYSNCTMCGRLLLESSKRIQSATTVLDTPVCASASL